jgi:hypothetical protein
VRPFLGALEHSQRRAASFAWDGPEWRGWKYFGSADFVKPGVRLEQMTAAQRDTAWAVLATLFAWYGPNTPEWAFGYRVIADGFVIEMVSADPVAQHLHTIYHDLGNVLGRSA